MHMYGPVGGGCLRRGGCTVVKCLKSPRPPMKSPVFARGSARERRQVILMNGVVGDLCERLLFDR